MKNASGSSLTPCGKKKEQNERTPANNQTVGVRPFISHRTKLAGKLFFPTYCNYLIFNNIIFELNRCTLSEVFPHIPNQQGISIGAYNFSGSFLLEEIWIIRGDKG